MLLARRRERRSRARALVADHIELAVRLAFEVLEDLLASRGPRHEILVVPSGRSPSAPVTAEHLAVGIKVEADTPTHSV